ncbi:MAG: LemA family protein [Patescibacteria group bacterium]
MDMIIWIILGLVGLFLLVLIFIYNSLVRLKNRVEEAWSDIDVQLKRRHDLIPNLVETVKGYAKHEKETFENVTQARSQAMQARESGGDTGQQAQAENMLTDTLKSLFAVAENYPDLKASQNFQELQRELSDTENKIQAARRFYNNNVMRYQTKTQSFPTNIIIKIFNFPSKQYFELENESERENIEVDF